MTLFERLGRCARPTRAACRLELPARTAIHAAVYGLSVAHEQAVINLAGGGQHHARGAVVGLEETAQGTGAETRHALGRAENGPTDRLLGKGGVLQELVGDLVGAVAGGGDLLQDDLALTLELLLGVARQLQDIRENIESDADIGFEHPGKVGGGLQAGGGVELAADRLDLLGDIAGAAPLRALEGHVLEQMGDAVLGQGLVPGTGGHPNAERHGFHMRHMVRHHAQTVGQLRKLGCHVPDPYAASLHVSTKRSTAPRSLGKVVTRSGRESKAASGGGKAGRSPVMAAMASGNLAGCAVASAICATCGATCVLRAATTAQALCGSSR